MRTSRIVAGLLLLMTVMPAAVHAHGGGLDRNGCHHDRRKGGYHCHRGPAAVVPARAADAATPSLRFDAGASPPRSTGAYRNCTEARAAGAAPVRRGEPGYGPHLDRDNDGIGCE